MSRSTIIRFILVLCLIGCDSKNVTHFQSKLINSPFGVSIDSLTLIYEGPEGYSLDYFPKEAIRSAGVRACHIIDSSLDRLERNITFDRNGNIILDENDFFQYWFKGTAQGTYTYYYDSLDHLIMMKGASIEESLDSLMTIYNYNSKGLLHSEDRYEFKKRLKPGADRHLPSPSDFEKHPTWHKAKTITFCSKGNTITITTAIDKKTKETERHDLVFDPTGHFVTDIEFRDTTLVEITKYKYDTNTITGFSEMHLFQGNKSTYISKAVLDNRKRQVEKERLLENGEARPKMVVEYEKNGTISRIRYGGSCQIFKYYYFSD